MSNLNHCFMKVVGLCLRIILSLQEVQQRHPIQSSSPKNVVSSWAFDFFKALLRSKVLVIRNWIAYKVYTNEYLLVAGPTSVLLQLKRWKLKSIEASKSHLSLGRCTCLLKLGGGSDVNWNRRTVCERLSVYDICCSGVGGQDGNCLPLV